jgi:hypothetical protein
VGVAAQLRGAGPAQGAEDPTDGTDPSPLLHPVLLPSARAGRRRWLRPGSPTTLPTDPEELSVPESRTRKSTDEKRRRTRQEGSKPAKVKAPSSRRWVPPTFITVGLLGVIWLIVYYVAGPSIPYMSDLGNWNILIGMGGMAAAFGIATLWR